MPIDLIIYIIAQNVLLVGYLGIWALTFVPLNPAWTGVFRTTLIYGALVSILFTMILRQIPNENSVSSPAKDLWYLLLASRAWSNYMHVKGQAFLYPFPPMLYHRLSNVRTHLSLGVFPWRHDQFLPVSILAIFFYTSHSTIAVFLLNPPTFRFDPEVEVNG